MYKKVFAFTVTAVMCLALCACGNKQNSSGNGTSGNASGSSQTAQGGDSSGSNSSGSNSSDSNSPGGSDSTETAGTDAKKQHYYKTVTFDGGLEQMYFDTGFECYNSATIIISYDTATGKAVNTKVAVYYDEQRSADETAYEREDVFYHVGSKMSEMPYTEGSFNYTDKNGYTKTVHSVIFDLGENGLDFEIHGWVMNFLLEQDIDAYLDRIFYGFLNAWKEYGMSRPYPIITEHSFYYDVTADAPVISWYDTDWELGMLNEGYAIRDKISMENDYDWEVEEYYPISINSGEGYGGTYDYRNYLREGGSGNGGAGNGGAEGSGNETTASDNNVISEKDHRVYCLNDDLMRCVIVDISNGIAVFELETSIGGNSMFYASCELSKLGTRVYAQDYSSGGDMPEVKGPYSFEMTEETLIVTRYDGDDKKVRTYQRYYG